MSGQPMPNSTAWSMSAASSASSSFWCSLARVIRSRTWLGERRAIRSVGLDGAARARCR